ncbi:MAG: DUF2065 domain-containing protein [Pseudomonadota bacterium]
MEFFFCVVGMVLVIEGIPYFLCPDKMKHVMRAILEQDDKTVRIFGASILIIGLLIVYFARNALSSP